MIERPNYGIFNIPWVEKYEKLFEANHLQRIPRFVFSGNILQTHGLIILNCYVTV